MALVEPTDGSLPRIEVLLNADAAQGDKQKNEVTDLLLLDRKSSSFYFGDDSVADVAKTIRSMKNLMSWRRKAGATNQEKSVKSLKKGDWVDLTAFCKEIGSAITGNLDATLVLYAEVCYLNDKVKAIVTEFVPKKMLMAALRRGNAHQTVPDKYLHKLWTLCVRYDRVAPSVSVAVVRACVTARRGHLLGGRRRSALVCIGLCAHVPWLLRPGGIGLFRSPTALLCAWDEFVQD